MPVRPSVRLSVTLYLSEPYLQEPFVQKIPKITYLLKFCNENLNSILPNILEVLAKNPLFEFVFCLDQISVTIKNRDTEFFCSVSKNIPILQRQSKICKMSNFGRF